MSDSIDRVTRRTFLGTSALAALGCATGASRSSASAPDARTGRVGKDGRWTLYVGTYTEGTKSEGIYRVSIDPSTLAASDAALAVASLNPSYIALAPDGRTLVAVNEVTEWRGAATGAVSAYRRDPATGALSPAVAQHPTGGGAPCYVSIDRTGRHVLVANYVGGNVSTFPLGDGGTLGAASTLVQHSGRGPTARQEQAHAHSIVLDPANRFALSADLGNDRIHVSRFDPASGALTPAAVPEVALPAGAGPRHLAFAPDGRTLYCANELDSTLAAFDYDGATGGLSLRQRLSTRPEGATGENLVADVHVGAGGDVVYISNRGDDSIAAIDVARPSGRLTLGYTVATGGKWPRNFTLTPDGRAILVANQRSDAIVVLRRDPSTGRVADTGRRIAVAAPVCLLFA